MAFHQTPDFEELIATVASALSSRSLPFMVIGGQAVLVHGEPRLTHDIDITLGVAPDRLRDLFGVTEQAGLTVLPEDPQSFVRETFVLPTIQEGTEIRVDFIFSTTPYEAQAIDRAVRVEIGSRAVPFAAIEDLILHKLFAGRPRDLEDVSGVVRRKGAEIDWEYLRRWARDFAEVPGREGLPDEVERLRTEHQR